MFASIFSFHIRFLTLPEISSCLKRNRSPDSSLPLKGLYAEGLSELTRFLSSLKTYLRGSYKDCDCLDLNKRQVICLNSSK